MNIDPSENHRMLMIRNDCRDHLLHPFKILFVKDKHNAESRLMIYMLDLSVGGQGLLLLGLVLLCSRCLARQLTGVIGVVRNDLPP